MEAEGAAAAIHRQCLVMVDLMMIKHRVWGVQDYCSDVLSSLAEFWVEIREHRPMHPAGGCMLQGLHSMTFLVEAVDVACVSVV